ncbi:MAG: class I SAM-dependent methyltransferase [Acidimicrobiales bacterium]
MKTGDAAAELRLYEAMGRAPVRPSVRFVTRMARRTHFVDVQVLEAIDRGVQQVVIVGAGYDGRALRFETPGVQWFEVDHPVSQRGKRAALTAAGANVDHIRFVPLDLMTGSIGESLRAKGFDDSEAALFVLEGLFTYLTTDLIDQLLLDLAELASPDSDMVATFFLTPVSPAVLGRIRERGRRLVLTAIREPRLSVFHPGDPEQTLAKAGWIPTSSEYDVPEPSGAGRFLQLVACRTESI